MPAPQQEPGQPEEHGDRQIEPAEQPPVDSSGVAGLERDMGDHHPDGRAGPHALDRGQEITRSTDLIGRHLHRHDDQSAQRLESQREPGRIDGKHEH